MLLRNTIKRTILVNKVATRFMGIKPKRELSEASNEVNKQVNQKVTERIENTRLHGNDLGPAVFSVKEFSDIKNEMRAATKSAADEAKNYKPGDQQRTEFYSKVSQIDPNDHEVIQKVKRNLRKLLDNENEFLAFCDELTEMEKDEIVESAANDLQKRRSFFFDYDDQKVHHNKRVYDAFAPGNTHRKIPYVLPHEHIHPQHHIDVKSLTDEDIKDLYAYYTLYVDFHIGQIRRSVEDKNYIPKEFNQISMNDTARTNERISNLFLEYYYHYRPSTSTWRSQTQEIDHQKEKDALPVNHHPDPRAFTKNEVEWSEYQKFPHVADRLGYPILAESPLERITGMERAPAHPSFQFQAFVQTPSMDPDPTLNFEAAETVYENKRIGEWIRMWKWGLTATLPLWPAFYTFEIYQNDGVPSLDWLSDTGSWFGTPKQMQDSGDWNLEGVRYADEHNYMNIQYIWKRTVIRPAHTMYQLCLLAVLNQLNFDYVTKMVYNKDKDLVFVYKPHGWFGDKEYVHEVHHLESMVPSVAGAVSDLGMGKKDGITTLNCMSTKQILKLYNDPKYWNLELRDDFIAQTRTMWPDLVNKYSGTVTEIASIPDERKQRHLEKVNQEIEEAVAKHGKVEPFPTYQQQFYDDIQSRRKRIAEQASA